jgi:hypothetical protein
MRKAILIVLVVILAAIAWMAWPLATLYALARAIESRDAPAIAGHLDPLSIRRSLSNQVAEALARNAGPQAGRDNILAAVAGSFVDPLVAAFVTPDGIALLLRSGWIGPEAPAGSPNGNPAQGLSTRALGDAWQVIRNSEWGFDRFSVAFPVDQPPAERFHLDLHWYGLSWRLADIRLPKPLADRMAQQLVRVQRR